MYFLTHKILEHCSEKTTDSLDFQKLIEHIYKKLLAKYRDIDDDYLSLALKCQYKPVNLENTLSLGNP